MESSSSSPHPDVPASEGPPSDPGASSVTGAGGPSSDPRAPTGYPHRPGVWSPEHMESHITILGALYIAFSVLGILTALGVSMLVIGGGLISGDNEARAITGLVGTCLGAFLLAVSLPGLVGGIYLMKRRRWARILVLVLGFLNLLNVPLGTILGAYTIWVLLKPEADEVFH